MMKIQESTLDGTRTLLISESETSWARVSVTLFSVRDGVECWIHDLDGSNISPAALRKIFRRAWQVARDWGVKEVWTNVDNPRVAEFLRQHGFHFEQFVLRGEVRDGY